MKDQVPPTVAAATAAPEKPAPREESRPAPEAAHRVVARYYRRMRLSRVYPMMVELQKLAEKRPAAGTVQGLLTIRPLVPGTQVTPAERELDVPGGGGASGVGGGPATGQAPRCIFQITPLARGKLREARLQIWHQGRLVQEVPLPTRVVRQRLTWVLLALTLLLPAALFYLSRYTSLTTAGRGVPSNKEQEALRRPDRLMPAAADEPKEAPAAVPPARPHGEPVARKLPGEDEPAEARGAGPAADLPGRGPARPDPLVPGGPRDMPPRRGLADLQGMPMPGGKIPPPAAPIQRDIEYFFPDVPQFPAVKKDVAAGAQYLYDCASDLEQRDHLSFWVGVVLLGLTAISWITHRGQRAVRRKLVALGS